MIVLSFYYEMIGWKEAQFPENCGSEPQLFHLNLYL